jgi:polysaccharide pyruvyl transferase WcaK-like protein
MNRRILLVNHWHDDNRGDSAITLATIALIEHRYPGSSLTVRSLLEEDDEDFERGCRHIKMDRPNLKVEGSLLPVLPTTAQKLKTRFGTESELVSVVAWLIRLLPFAIMACVGHIPKSVKNDVKRYDLVVAIGGSNLFDSPETNGLVSAARLFGLLYPVWCAVKLNVPVVAPGHSLGPFSRRFTECRVASIFRQISTTQVRDDDSSRFCSAHGIRAIRVPDLAFSLGGRETERVSEVIGELPVAPKRVLGISVRLNPARDPDMNERVLSEIADAARQLMRSNEFDYTALIAQTTGPIEFEDDRPSSISLLSKLPTGRSQFVEEDLSPQELIALYGQFGAVLAIRLHAAILAIDGGAPTVAIAYFGHKTAGAMQSVGLERMWIDYDSVSASDVAKAVRSAVALVETEGSGYVFRRRAAADQVIEASAHWPALGESSE